jgi:hypothetical protein
MLAKRKNALHSPFREERKHAGERDLGLQTHDTTKPPGRKFLGSRQEEKIWCMMPPFPLVGRSIQMMCERSGRKT